MNKHEGIEISNPEETDPQAVIAELMQQASAMGRNDVEFPRFKEIQDLLRRGECSPEEAIHMAREVRFGKQDH